MGNPAGRAVVGGAPGTPLALGMLGLGTVSLLLIAPYPEAESRRGHRP